MLTLCRIFVLLGCLSLFATVVAAEEVFVVNIPDANTIQVAKWPGTKTPEKIVQPYGILAPSRDQPFGREAIQELNKTMPAGTKIDIEVVGEPSGGIETALVQVNGHSVNYSLVSKGLAWVNRAKCKAVYCRRWHIEEHKAVQARLGVWSVDEAYRPWQWGH